MERGSLGEAGVDGKRTLGWGGQPSVRISAPRPTPWRPVGREEAQPRPVETQLLRGERRHGPGREQDAPTLQCRAQPVCACGLKRTRRTSDSQGWELEGHPKRATNTDSTFRREAPAPRVALRSYGSRDTVRWAEAVHTPATVGTRGTPLGSL